MQFYNQSLLPSIKDDLEIKKWLKTCQEKESKPAPKKKAKKKKVSESEESSDDEGSSNGLEPGAYWLDEKRMRRIQVGFMIL